MTVRTVQRRGERRILVIDIRYRDKSGGKARYRHDAEVQTRAAATAEDRRRLAALAVTGSPYEVAMPVAVEQVAAQPVSTAPTFAATAADYLTAYAVSNLKPSTRAGYTKILNGYLLDKIGDMPIDKIDAAKVRDLDAGMVRRGAKPGTRRQMAIVIRSIVCRYAVEAGLLPSAPRLPALPSQGAKMPSTMARAEVDAVLAASTPGHRLAFLLAADAGLRAGEVRGLRRGDIDLEAGLLTIREARCRGVTAAPKSGHEREVPLSPRLRAALVELAKGDPRAPVSVTEAGTPWGEYGLLQAFKRALVRAGIVKPWRFHDLRHHFVTALFKGGVGANTVQALAGHANLATTARYAHTGRADARAAIAQLGA